MAGGRILALLVDGVVASIELTRTNEIALPQQVEVDDAVGARETSAC